jgi:hypothetical protein
MGLDTQEITAINQKPQYNSKKKKDENGWILIPHNEQIILTNNTRRMGIGKSKEKQHGIIYQEIST